MSAAPVLLIAAANAERDRLVHILERLGHTVIDAEGISDARTRLHANPGATIVLDLASPEALRFLRAPSVQRSGVPVICIADRRRPEASSEALRLGIADLVSRPVSDADLAAATRNAREFADVARQPSAQLPSPPDVPAGMVFGASRAIREALSLVQRIASSRCHVLLIGERGTGRESIARTIHGQSGRNDGPLVRIECAGAVREELDATLDRLPAGATVYLDEMHALDRASQQLLAARIRSGGDASTRGLRFVGAVGPRVDDAVARGELDADLVEAIGVVRLELPPLRQRRDDIALLATHFLKEACRQQGVPPKSFSRSALTLLSALPWPGNAAELRALTERLAVLATRGVVLLEDVLANVRLEGAEALAGPSGTLREAREKFERQYVAFVLQQHRGRMGDAARELGIERTNLYRKIKQLNIRWTVD